MIERKDIVIIIPHFGAKPEQCFALKQCLDSLAITEPEIEILVVKNGNIGCQCRRDIRIVGQGQCKAVNAAVAITNTPWFLVTNDDMIYPPGWFDKLTSNIEYEDVLCVSPKLIEPHQGAPTFETFFAGGAGGDFNRESFYKFSEQYDLRSEEEKKLRTGFNLPFLMERTVWDTVGGYDINYDPWGSNSDSDLEYKLVLAGVQPMQNQRCIVYHFSQTSGTFEPRNQSYWSKNWDYFIQKWGFPRTDDGIWQADFVIPTPQDGRVFTPWWEDCFAQTYPEMQIERTI